ncbi:PREDICTED: dual specificity protein kinase splB-like [Polistes dominula]|uniref:Dual specificity protein kinase splB-like n=1 Tax=Polistes dominula TaxID=743375 RepID=A0ABM1J8A6_POLDO|nr:PREDICTED: dual specificity protein kinase splB-like [Polistes dominula]
MALRRRRGNNFTHSLNHFQSQSLKPVVGEKCDNNISKGKSSMNSEFAIENDMEDHSLISQNNIKFGNILYALDGKLNPTEAELTKQEIYRRLSDKYIASPQKFTKKLITIIEESILNNTLNASNISLINFDKISKELNKMCNIENESMPQQLFSTTVNVSPSGEVSKNVNSFNSTTNNENMINLDSPKIKTPELTNPRKKVYRKTPISIFKTQENKLCDISPESSLLNPRKKVYRKTPISIFKTQKNKPRDVSPEPSCSTDSSFEYLEAHCKRLYPNEKKDLLSAPPVKDNNSLNMDRVVSICEKQMASLDSTNDLKIKMKKRSSILKSEPKTEDSDSSYLYSIPGNSSCNDKNRNEKVKVTNKRKNDLDSEYLNNTDDFSKTLLSEIVKKRRRCFDTAKKMMEINSACNIIEEQKKTKSNSKSILDVNSNKPSDNSSQFMKMLMSCEDYHNYLDNKLTVLDASSINSTFNSTLTIPDEKKNTNINVIPSKKNVSPLSSPISYNENYEKVLARWNICENNKKKLKTMENNINNESKFFTTPGKLFTKGRQKRKIYFSDLSTLKKQSSSPKTMTNHNSNYNTNCKLLPGFKYKVESRKSRRMSLRKLSKLNATPNKNKENEKGINIQ